MTDRFEFFDCSALLDRVSHFLRLRPQEVVFLLGSPLSAPIEEDARGIADTSRIIDRIRDEFSDNPSQSQELERVLGCAGERVYQAAFTFLQGRRGQSAVNEVVRKAVLGARKKLVESKDELISVISSEEILRTLDADIEGWALNSGTEAVGKLVSDYPDRFGGTLLTTNFDPLIEVAVAKGGGSCYRTMLHADGDLHQTQAAGCHIVHLHGYWYGTDTLHSARQLQQLRPRLKASLATLLRGKLVVICGYGGWDDFFTGALMEVVSDDSANPEVLWSFFNSQPLLNDFLSRCISPGYRRGRVSLYSGVDCNQFFPDLHRIWLTIEAPSNRYISRPHGHLGPVHVSDSLKNQLREREVSQPVIEGDDEDRPPQIDFIVGRESELRDLEETNANTVFISGLGREGKSKILPQCSREAAVHLLRLARLQGGE
jgi:hypothetical protein